MTLLEMVKRVLYNQEHTEYEHTPSELTYVGFITDNRALFDYVIEIPNYKYLAVSIDNCLFIYNPEDNIYYNMHPVKDCNEMISNARIFNLDIKGEKDITVQAEEFYERLYRMCLRNYRYSPFIITGDWIILNEKEYGYLSVKEGLKTFFDEIGLNYI